MPDFFAPWGRLFGALAIDAALIVAATFVLQRFVRTAAWRRAFWQVAFLGLGFVSLAEIGGIKQVAMFANPGEAKQGSSAQFVFQVSTNASPNLAALATELRRTSLNSVARASATDARVQPLAWWPGWVWLLGCAAMAIWMATARLIFVCCVRRDLVRDDTIVKRAHTLACRLGLRRRVAVSETPGLAGPIAFGILRPGISLPEGFGQRFSATQQEAMLAHELAHLAARDPLWLALADALAALFWWHPLVWVARRQLRAASEAAADEASLLVENGPTALAECLVELGGRLTRTRSLAWLGMEGGEFRSGLGRRVKRLVTMPSQQWRPIRRTSDWLVKTLGVTSVVIVALAATAWLQPREARSDSFSQAFRESVIGLALIAAFPEPQTENFPTEPAVDFERIDWRPWSRAAVAAARAEGHPVLVNFTADWAVTAQVNEKTGLDVPVVRAKLREIGAVALRADYTMVPEDIADELRSFGRDGVPLVLVYAADSNTPPKVLPAVLTPEIILNALEQVAPFAASVVAPSNADATREKNRVTGLLFEGKALHDAGRIAEAEAKWREAFRLDPQNPATKNYLTLVEKIRLEASVTNSSSGASPIPTDRSREALNRKLDTIRLGEVTFEGQSLKDVVKELAKLVKAPDSEGKGVNFILLDEVSQTTVNLMPALKDITLRQTLDAIISTSSAPLKYSVESYAVVISPSSTPTAPLHTRWFKIDPTTTAFVNAIRGWLGTNAASSQTNRAVEVAMSDLRRIFDLAGVDLARPKSVLFNHQLGQLMVRATLQDLDVVEQLIQVLNVSPPQITLEVKFCEMSEQVAQALGFKWLFGGPAPTAIPGAVGVTGILTDPQYRVVQKALAQRNDVKITDLPKVTTLSGRQAQVKAVQMRHIVTRIDPATNGVGAVAGTNSAIGGQPVAEPFELGPVVDLVPVVKPDGHSIGMTIKASLQEFEGYDMEGGTRIVTTADGRKEIVKSSDPNPIFRRREIVSNAVVWNGQTIVLFDGSDGLVGPPKSNVPLLGDLPFMGRLFRETRDRSGRTNLIIFVTPTLIDPTGNRISSE